MVYDGLDFFLDGVSAKSVGIYMQSEPIISPIQAEIETFNVPGRVGGPLHAFYGTYKERTLTIPCYAIQYDNNRDSGYYSGNGVYAVMKNIMEFLFPVGSGQGGMVGMRSLRVGWTNETFKAFVTNGADINARLKTLNPFTIEFLINPVGFATQTQSR